jgi:uncharacterized protein DUF4383
MIRTFALVFGIVYLLVGILGFVPGLVQPAHHGPSLAVESNHGLLFGLFPVNLLHNIVHLLIGIWGIAASVNMPAARFYARGLAVFYGLLAVLGLLPATGTLFGLVPIHGHDVWLHGASALIAAYFGFVAAPDQAPASVRRDRAGQS